MAGDKDSPIPHYDLEAPTDHEERRRWAKSLGLSYTSPEIKVVDSPLGTTVSGRIKTWDGPAADVQRLGRSIRSQHDHPTAIDIEVSGLDFTAIEARMALHMGIYPMVGCTLNIPPPSKYRSRRKWKKIIRRGSQPVYGDMSIWEVYDVNFRDKLYKEFMIPGHLLSSGPRL